MEREFTSRRSGWFDNYKGSIRQGAWIASVEWDATLGKFDRAFWEKDADRGFRPPSGFWRSPGCVTVEFACDEKAGGKIAKRVRDYWSVIRYSAGLAWVGRQVTLAEVIGAVKPAAPIVGLEKIDTVKTPGPAAPSGVEAPRALCVHREVCLLIEDLAKLSARFVVETPSAIDVLERIDRARKTFVGLLPEGTLSNVRLVILPGKAFDAPDMKPGVTAHTKNGNEVQPFGPSLAGWTNISVPKFASENIVGKGTSEVIPLHPKGEPKALVAVPDRKAAYVAKGSAIESETAARKERIKAMQSKAPALPEIRKQEVAHNPVTANARMLELD